MSAVRPRPALLPCAHCGATRFLRIAPVREHGAGGEPIPMAVRWIARARRLGPLARAVSCVGPSLVDEPSGTFTLLLCEGCGDTRWFARDVELELTGDDATLGDCADCGDRRARSVGPVKTRGHGGLPSELRVFSWTSRRWGFSSTRTAGRFSAFVCRGCTRVTWIASGLEAAPRAARTSASPCRRCRHDERICVDPVNEDGATLRVVYDKQHLRETRIGRYALSICAGCGLTEWSAHDVAALGPDASLGVARLEVAEANEGPYR